MHTSFIRNSILSRESRCRTTTAIVVFVLLPSISFALMTSTAGNKKLNGANYTDWPGLIEAINNPSRVFQVWVNGNESFSYSGDTASLNRVLKNFAATKVDKLEVVLRPGPGSTVQMDDKKKKQVDWEIQILGGIALASIKQRGLDTVWNVHPTLTIHVTDRLKLDEIEIPDNVKLSGLDNLRKKYTAAQKGNPPKPEDAGKQALDALDKDAKRKGKAAENFKNSSAAIRAYIAKWRKAKAKAK